MSFAHELSQRLRKLEEEDTHVNEGYWYPTQLGFCPRSAVLQHAGVEELAKDDRTLRVFYTGRIVHQAVQDMHPWTVVGHELRVRNDDYKVSGRIDSYTILPDGTREVQEFKTMNSRSFSYSDLPKKEHILQLGVYLLWAARCEQCSAVVDGETVYNTVCGLCDTTRVLPLPQRGRLVYISKDDLRVEEFLVTMTSELEKEIKDKLRFLEESYQQYVKDGSLPEPLPLVEKKGKPTKANPLGTTKLEMAWQTKYCGFRGSGKCCGDVVNVGEDDATHSERDDSPEGALP